MCRCIPRYTGGGLLTTISTVNRPGETRLVESFLGVEENAGGEVEEKARRKGEPVQTRLAVSSSPTPRPVSVQEDRDVLTGKSPALLLLPACTLTYICWNRVRRPRVRATETHYPEEFLARRREREAVST